MKLSKSRRIRLLGLAAVLTPVLTACPMPPSPPPPGIGLSFSYPPKADTTDLTLAAITFSSTGQVTVVNSYGGYYGPYAAQVSPVAPPPVNFKTSSLYLDGYALQNLLSPTGTNCRSFKDDQDKGLGTITVTPADVKTCYVYFIAFADGNRNNKPEAGEEVYMTHDVLSYADKDFSYSGASTDGKVSTSGSVKVGWTVLRHSVLQPASTPGGYKVTMTSVPVEDQAIAIQMHEPSNFLTSLSLSGSSVPGLSLSGLNVPNSGNSAEEIK
jgi:hypothetical protein